MSILEKIRSRAGLLVAIIGIALFAFILGDLVGSGNSTFLNDNNVGEIYGEDISIQEFNARVQQSEAEYMRNSQQTTLDDMMRDMIVQDVWRQLVDEKVIKKEYEKLGITVSPDELTDMMLVNPHYYVRQNLTDRNTGKIREDFALPNGDLDIAKLNDVVKKFTPQDEQMFWIPLEKAVREIRVSEKYINLIKKGMYVTKSQARHDFIAENKSYNIRYVVKQYSTVADSTVNVTEEDMQNYYNEHKSEYRQEASCKIDYVTFDISPSKEDFNEVKKEIEKITEDFKSKKKDEDSSFVVAESESRKFDDTYYKKGKLPEMEIDSLMFSSEPGTVYGPYLRGTTYKVAKLIDKKYMADSVKVSHMLVTYKGAERANPSITRTQEQAKAYADSIYKIINDDKTKFKEYAKNNSDDIVAAAKDGELGWVMRGQQGWDERFLKAAVGAKKGDVVLAEGNFGFHIIEVNDMRDTFAFVKVAIIDHEVKPGKNTLQAAYGKASEFAGKSRTPEDFEKAIAAQKLKKETADNIKPESRSIPGLTNAKELIRWMYTSEKGAVSEPMEVGYKYVIAHLTEVKEKGIATLEQVKTEIEVQAKQQKKAEKFITELESGLKGSSSIDDAARKTNLSVEKFDDIKFNSSYIGNLGREPVVIGTLVTMKQNVLSKPIKGNSGVYVLVVDAVKEAQDIKDYTANKTSAERSLQSRAEAEVPNALKEKANIKDYKVKYF